MPKDRFEKGERYAAWRGGAGALGTRDHLALKLGKFLSTQEDGGRPGAGKGRSAAIKPVDRDCKIISTGWCTLVAVPLYGRLFKDLMRTLSGERATLTYSHPSLAHLQDAPAILRALALAVGFMIGIFVFLVGFLVVDVVDSEGATFLCRRSAF